MLFVLLWRLIKLRIMLKLTYFFLGADARAVIPFHSLNSHLRLGTQKNHVTTILYTEVF